jgi:hypothetical protein
MTKTFTTYFAALAHAHNVDATLTRMGCYRGPADLWFDGHLWVVSSFK